MMNTTISNAKIYTKEGVYNWMRFDNGIIQDLGVGEIDGIDMGGKVILPGLVDAHLHINGIGRYLDDLNIKNAGSIEEVKTKLKNYTAKRKGWIVGRGWDQDIFEDKRLLNKTDLDDIVLEHPVMLYRACNHIAVINSKAMELAGIDNTTKDPSGGKIDRDENGEPTGIIRETALTLVSTFIKVTQKEERKELLRLGLRESLKVGLTGVQTNDATAWELYKELQEEGDVPIRVYLTPYHNEIGLDGTPKAGTMDGLLYCDRVKLFADGSLGAQTAAMREPYADTGEHGIPIYSQEELNKLVKEADDADYRLEIHAIGDLAAEMVINAFEINNITDRPILTHAQILGKDLVERMAHLGIIANIQPPFIITDGVWVDKRLGKNSERVKYAYAWKTLIESGVKVAGGSDSPIESNNPLLGIYSAIYRETAENKVWRKEECLTFDEALDMYTTGAAYATKKEDCLGKLAKGYKADFIVLDLDVLDNPRNLKNAKVLEVYVDGINKLI